MITGDDSHALKNEGTSGILAPNTRFRMSNSITCGFVKGVKFGCCFTKATDCTFENNWLASGSFSVDGRLNLTNTTHLVVRRLTLGGKLITSAAQLGDQVKDCKDVVVE